MNIDAFKQELIVQNYSEITMVERPAGYSLGSHQHPFDAKALITQGGITLVVDGAATQYGIGEVFELARGTHHEEYALHGVAYLAGRRH